MNERAVVVGAGPSGFYASELLLRAGFNVDVIDRLPTPYGLVRAGVAPDHPNIKAVTRVYERTATSPGFRFFGGVELGSRVTRAELLERYHAVIYAYGTSHDNRLGIPGEDRPGSYSATDFVAWYNGHPDHADRIFDLDVPRAVVIGNGNVAIDVARMLLLDPGELAATDVADHALAALARAKVQEVVVVGRRGPVQAAFTNPELRELGALAGVDLEISDEALTLDAYSARYLEEGADASTRRNIDVMRDYAKRVPTSAGRVLELKFLRSPVEIMGDGLNGRVTGVRFERNEISTSGAGRLQAIPTGDEEVLACGAVFRSIGYRGSQIDGIPFDEDRGLICNDNGRVTNSDGTRCRGEYVVGWIKRGPSGVIGTNKKDAAETTTQILADRDARVLNEPEAGDSHEIGAWLDSRAPRRVTWEGWRAIDEVETSAGAVHSRPRVKLVRYQALDEAARVRPQSVGVTED